MNDTVNGPQRPSRNESLENLGGWLVILGLVIEIFLAIAFHKPESSWVETWGLVIATAIIAGGVWMEIRFGGNARAEAEARTAEANARADEAIKAAESEKLERIKLEASVAPRRISQDAQTLMAEDLQAFAGQQVRVISYALDLEGAMLGQQLLSVFAQAGMVSVNGLSGKTALGSFAVGLLVHGSNFPLITAISDALKKHCSLVIVFDERVSVVTPMSQGTANLPPDQFAATVLVGVKPMDATNA